MKRRIGLSIFTLALFVGVLLFVKARGLLPIYQTVRRKLVDAFDIDIMRYDQWIILTGAAVIGLALVRSLRLPAIADEAGLIRPVLRALIFALLATLPMLVGFALMGRMHIGFALMGACLVYPFIEEFFFRGWAFRQLAVRAGWGFWPAGLLTGLFFGLAHLSAARITKLELDMNDAMTVLVTGAGGVFFAWLFMAWNWNLWVPILLHALMNTWWAVFAVDGGAVGGIYANICRALTIVAAIFLTLNRHRIPGLKPRRRSDGAARNG